MRRDCRRCALAVDCFTRPLHAPAGVQCHLDEAEQALDPFLMIFSRRWTLLGLACVAAAAAAAEDSPAPLEPSAGYLAPGGAPSGSQTLFAPWHVWSVEAETLLQNVTAESQEACAALCWQDPDCMLFDFRTCADQVRLWRPGLLAVAWAAVRAHAVLLVRTPCVNRAHPVPGRRLRSAPAPPPAPAACLAWAAAASSPSQRLWTRAAGAQSGQQQVGSGRAGLVPEHGSSAGGCRLMPALLLRPMQLGAVLCCARTSTCSS